MATPQDLLQAISRAFVLSDLRAPDDPALAEALGAAQEVHRALGWQVIRVEDEGFTVNQVPVTAGGEELFRFWATLAGARIREMRLQDPLPPDQLLDFLLRLKGPDGPESVPGSARFRGLEGFLGLSFRRGDRPPSGMVGSVEELFHLGVGGESEEGKGDVDTATIPPDEALPQEARELVEAFLGASGSQKTALGEAIAASAAHLREARDLGSVANLVEVLAEASEGGVRDSEALALAIRLTSTGVASHLIGRLGSTREEEDRQRLIGIYSGLGREMALALTDALGEARDRFQRRSFLEALVAQGEMAREMAERMVQDPRWYVGRNGVALLGELGEEGAVSNLTSTLANEDPRVRKETVMALAKMGGDDASTLLLGMLDDSDAEVRAKACWAAGVLKVEKAVKPLLALLEKENHEGVQVECLHALGKIGDPGAVPLVERKATGRRRFFSRSSKEIRMAAFRALAAIGTPHARSLLLKAAKDSDLEVRKLAVGLLE